MQKGFFASLFDTSFSSLITPRIIKVLYVIILVVIGLLTLVFIVSGISQGGGGAVFAIILAPIFALLYTIFARVYLEIIIVLFKIGDNTAQMVTLAGGTPSGIHGTVGAEVAPTTSLGTGGAAAAPAATGAAAPAGGQSAPPSGGQAPGWYSDPQGQKRLRYWDGSSWTEHTAD